MHCLFTIIIIVDDLNNTHAPLLFYLFI